MLKNRSVGKQGATIDMFIELMGPVQPIPTRPEGTYGIIEIETGGF